MTAAASRTQGIGVLWAGLVVYSALYLPLFLVFHNRPGNPQMGFWLWLLTAWLAFAIVLGGFGLVAWLTSGSRPTGDAPVFGPIVPSRWARRTGITGTDWLGLALAVVASVLAVKSALWFPWLAVVVFVFAVTVFLLKPEPWPIHPRREIPAPPLPQPLDPSEDSVERAWNWSCRCRQLDTGVRLRVRTSAVHARGTANPSRNGLSVGDWEQAVKHLVEEGAKDREPAEAARQLLAFARANRFNYFEEAQNTLQLAQVIQYSSDQQSKGMEYFRYAIETFYDETGDCDCKAILAATLFRLMGLRSVVLLSVDEEHAAVAVEGAPDFPGNQYFEWNGGRFYFCETTDGTFGFSVGEVPPGVNLASYAVRVGIDPAMMGAVENPT